MCPSDHKDYSGTPLWRKLGVRPGSRVLVIGAPAGFDDALEAIEPPPDGVRWMTRATRDLDVAIVFVTEVAALHRRFDALTRSIARDGRLWVAWPKRASKVPTDLTFEHIQSLGLRAGLVDNKSAAIDDVYQGLQFVVRLKDRV